MTNPVYPITYENQCEDNFNSGLTKREYFASAAMQGLISNPRLFDMKINDFAKVAVEAADNIIKKLGVE